MKFIYIFLLYVNYIECARILGLFYFPGRSQYMGGVALMKILAKRGHHVTMVSPFGEEKPPENYRDVVLDGIKEEARGFVGSNYIFSNYFKIYTDSTKYLHLINSTLSHQKLRRLLDSEEFDLLIMEQLHSTGLAYIAHYLNIPLILYSSIDSCSWTNHIVGIPVLPSFIPDELLDFDSEMSFFQRLDNIIMLIINEFIRNFIEIPAHNKIVQENFPNAPDISVYQQHNDSLVFLNGFSSINPAVLKVPAKVDIAGFHIERPKSLPEDLANILDTAKHGVILFSMGTILDCANLPNDAIKAFLGAFSGLKQTIIWKWGGEAPPEIPKNVIMRKWLPQNDVLANKNVKLFITHGGIHSIQEAVYHGIPCLVIPLFGDQSWNRRGATDAGYARSIQFNEITKEALLPILNDLLNDPKYTESAKKISILMRDRIPSPTDTVAFWVDYVIRHKGADHLKITALKQRGCRYNILEVVAFIIAIIFLIHYIVKYLIKCYMEILRTLPYG